VKSVMVAGLEPKWPLFAGMVTTVRRMQVLSLLFDVGLLGTRQDAVHSAVETERSDRYVGEVHHLPKMDRTLWIGM
jgi:hypothetical protein